MTQALPLDERLTNTEPGAVATGFKLGYRSVHQQAMLEPEFLHCGSTNTEPGAVATGFKLGYRLLHQQAMLEPEFFIVCIPT